MHLPEHIAHEDPPRHVLEVAGDRLDPIRELGQLALERDLLLHVDGCMGGFLLQYFVRLGASIPDYDFRVPGVTSISMDLHKYAFAAKGASTILYRSKDVRKYQMYACSNWTGYTVINPTVQSTKSAGPIAASVETSSGLIQTDTSSPGPPRAGCDCGYPAARPSRCGPSAHG